MITVILRLEGEPPSEHAADALAVRPLPRLERRLARLASGAMIASLRGRLTSEDLDGLVIEVGEWACGWHPVVGSRRARAPVAPSSSRSDRADRAPRTRFTLYGFADLDERDLFNLLRGVNGRWPAHRARDPLAAPARDRAPRHRRRDIAQLTRVSGVGRKLAERLALELRERVGTPGPATVEISQADGEYADAVRRSSPSASAAAQADEALVETSRATPASAARRARTVGGGAVSDERTDRGGRSWRRRRCRTHAAAAAALRVRRGRATFREQLAVFLGAAAGARRSRSTTCSCSTPGLGKTTLAHIIAAETGGSLTSISGPAIDRKGDLARS